MGNFISEDDLLTFEGYLKYQAVDPTSMTPGELKEWREIFEEAMERQATSPKVGRMKLRAVLSGEQRYAVAIQDGSDLWLTMWVRCSPKGEVFILYPRGDRRLNAHASYHLDGTFHHKSSGAVCSVTVQQRQPLSGAFKGTEDLGAYGGHGSKSIGAICDPAAFTGVVVVEPGRLGPRDGYVSIDLAEPGYEPAPVHDDHIIRQVFSRTGRPSVVITVAGGVTQS